MDHNDFQLPFCVNMELYCYFKRGNMESCLSCYRRNFQLYHAWGWGQARFARDGHVMILSRDDYRDIRDELPSCGHCGIALFHFVTTRFCPHRDHRDDEDDGGYDSGWDEEP